MGKLTGKTIFITGASRGIGKAIALKAAEDGANIVIAAKTDIPHPKLPGTIYTAADEIIKAGGNCLPCVVDVRHEDQVRQAVKKAVDKFGGIDILINNASAISLTGTEATSMKQYDLMNNINTRGTYLCSKICYSHLVESAKRGRNPHILNISPPLNMKSKWFKNHTAYTMAKYGMSMCVLGMAEEFKPDGISVNALWPKTIINTAAIRHFGDELLSQGRTPEIMADAAYAIISKATGHFNGQFLIDEFVLYKEGVRDFTKYSVNSKNSANLLIDLFLDEDSLTKSKL